MDGLDDYHFPPCGDRPALGPGGLRRRYLELLAACRFSRETLRTPA